MTPARATWLIARLAWKRLFRGRAIWFTGAVLALPAIIAVTGERDPGRWRAVIETVTLLLAVVPPLHLATAISDEVEDNTFTYLWSRPIPRWTLLSGKLLAVTPALIVLFAVAIAVPYLWLFGGGDAEVLTRAIGGASTAVVSIGLVALGLGSIVPKYPLGTVIAYMMMFDLAVGEIPFSINQLSITHHMRVIAGIPDELEDAAAAAGLVDAGTISSSVTWALGLGLVWFGIALWRVTVAEFATSK